MKGLSTRFHLALGLSSLVLSILLVALYFGLVPDRDAAVRAGRLALAEAVAASSTALMDEQEDSNLRNLLGFIARRNPELLSIGLRRADGVLLIEFGAHQDHWQKPRTGASTDARLVVPILQGRARWGHAELRFTYPDTNLELIAESTEFEFPVADNLSTTALPEPALIEFIRSLDPLKIHERELSQDDRVRTFELNGV